MKDAINTDATNQQEELDLLREENARLKALAAATAPEHRPKIVHSTFEAKVMKDGKAAKKTYGFIEGSIFLRHKGLVYRTEMLCDLANGKRLTATQLHENPNFNALVSTDGSEKDGAAKAILQTLVDLESGILIEK
jgi:hypothetical protein